jgi:hypothetical protein
MPLIPFVNLETEAKYQKMPYFLKKEFVIFVFKSIDL